MPNRLPISVGFSRRVGSCSFADVGELVRYLAIVPWEVPEDFTVERYADQLLALHHRCLTKREPITVTQRRFYLLVGKPAHPT